MMATYVGLRTASSRATSSILNLSSLRSRKYFRNVRLTSTSFALYSSGSTTRFPLSRCLQEKRHFIAPSGACHCIQWRLKSESQPRYMSRRISSAVVVGGENQKDEQPKNRYIANGVSNIPDSVKEKIGRNLHLLPHHPISILRRKIYDYFDNSLVDALGERPHFKKVTDQGLLSCCMIEIFINSKLAPILESCSYLPSSFSSFFFLFLLLSLPSFSSFFFLFFLRLLLQFDDFMPQVTIEQNFDSLLVPSDHVCRSSTDTYYVNHDHVLRTHTSAHQTTLLKQGEERFLVTGDCYRRDSVDATHFPLFHQMEGVRIFNKSQVTPELVEKDMKDTLAGLFRHLMGEEVKVKWVDEYFPFTRPSFEMEVLFRGEWMEVGKLRHLKSSHL